MSLKQKIIGVMGDGNIAYDNLAKPVGKAIALSGYSLLTGGGGGTMESVAGAFCGCSDRKGVSVGIIGGVLLACYGDDEGIRHRPFYINEFVEIPINTHLPSTGKDGRSLQSRNHINILSADMVIALPGGLGTFSEVELAVQYNKNLVLFIGDNTIGGHNAGYFLDKYPQNIKCATSIDEVEKEIRRI